MERPELPEEIVLWGRWLLPRVVTKEPEAPHLAHRQTQVLAEARQTQYHSEGHFPSMVQTAVQGAPQQQE
jgi:hypothetical protein